MKNEFYGRIMSKFVGLRAKSYSQLIDDSIEDKKQKAQKSVSYKENLNFKVIKNCLEATQLDNKIIR